MPPRQQASLEDCPPQRESEPAACIRGDKDPPKSGDRFSLWTCASPVQQDEATQMMKTVQARVDNRSVHHPGVEVVLELDEVIGGISDYECEVRLGHSIKAASHVLKDGELSQINE